MSDDMASLSPRQIAGLADEPAPFAADPLTKRETLELVRAYCRISDPQVRRSVFDLAKTLAIVSDA